MHHICIITILGPFIDSTQIENYKQQLAMDHAMNNSNRMIRIFWNLDVVCNLLEEDEQQVTCKISHNDLHTKFTTTFVYAKCKEHLR